MKVSAKSPKATVLIGTFNRPDYLREAVASVVAQTMKDWELLVMNDGGVDVRHIIDEFQDPRIHYFHDEVNKGLAHRLNFGLKQAKGEYIAYLGDDDRYYPNHLEVLTKALDEHPDVGVVYSDLYAVNFIKDKAGKRFPLNKFVQVSRDFNRDFMLYFNHTLHVSLVHRKNLGLLVRGYDENVKVLIDWDLTRKLSFFTNFKYIPVITGEYYMAINKSDRISVKERKDKENFLHNLRRIKSDLPPEPWVYIRKVAVVLPVDKWSDEVNQFIANLADNTSYPYRLILVNNDIGMDEQACWKALGKLSELKNIQIFTPEKALPELEAYRFAVDKTDAEFIYLLSLKADCKLQMRIFFVLDYLTAHSECDAVKLDIKGEQESLFNVLVRKESFYKLYHSKKEKNNLKMAVIPCFPPKGLAFDVLYKEAKKEYDAKNYKQAFKYFKAAESIKSGIPGEQYRNELRYKIALALKNYEEAEKKCLDLIEKGYQAENWIRLGQIYQAQKKYTDAIAAYQNGLKQIGLRESDLENPVFPITHPTDFGSFTALIGLGECLVEVSEYLKATKTFHRAFKLKANSHRPFLGFAKVFLANNQMEQAKQAILKASQLDGNDPEINRVTGALCEKENRPDLAFSCYLKAFERDKTDPASITLVCKIGSTLGKWEEMKKALQEFLEHHPAHLPSISYLAQAYLELGDMKKAEEITQRGLALDRWNEGLLNISFKLRHAHKFDFKKHQG
ncbi:MAG: glycosyltransferase [Deltaproteobacteria bacterium]|nr:glycosyltransferase [Deltaproteobacteria bacterium]